MTSWQERQEEIGHLKGLNISGRVILRCMLKNVMLGYGQDSSGSGYGLVSGSSEHRNESLGSVKCW
jgi:hypothetical protein